MPKLTVTYREKDYHIDIESTKYVSDLKKEVSVLTELDTERFTLLCNDTKLTNTKPLSYYVNHGSNFKLADVIIDVTVILNGETHDYNVGELLSVGEFAKGVLRLTGHDTEISFYYMDRKLVETDTLLYGGVMHKSILKAVNGKKIKNSIHKCTLFHGLRSFSIVFDERKTVKEFKEAIAEKVMQSVDDFCLKQDNIFLTDTKKMSVYLESGTTFSLENVTNKVTVVLKGKEYVFNAKESATINDFKTEILLKSGHTGDISLHSCRGVLDGTKTILQSGITNKDIILAVVDNQIIKPVERVTVVYRSDSYNFDIDTSKTVLDLKQMVSENIDLKLANFSLQFYWMPLIDTNLISNYIKFGTNLKVENAIIFIIIKLDGKTYNFNVKETNTIDEFVTEMKQKVDISDNIVLVHGQNKLDGSNTLLSSEVKHGDTIIATTTTIGGGN